MKGPDVMPINHILTKSNFHTVSHSLRKEFETYFSDPRQTHPKRFVWDFWHVPDQYTLLRTPAYEYFSPKSYMKLHRELVLWGRRTLGCWDISPPWLSCYIDGCKQELHSDVPHGPWAFVFSLTPAKKKFTGGETLILKPEVLNYWKHFLSTQDRELSSFVDRLPSRFNELIVFDPRYPHAVTEVAGSKNPMEGRLVIHGWFTEPKTYIEGYLPAKTTEKILNQAYEKVVELILKNEPTQGTMSLQIKVSKSGAVTQVDWGTKNLLNLAGESPRHLFKEIEKIYKQLNFPIAKGTTNMTVPLIVG